MLLHDLVRTSAGISPDAAAVFENDNIITYSRLLALSGELAAGLVGLGVQPRQRIAIYLPKTLPNVISILGCSRSGAVFVPVNPVLKSGQVEHIVRDSGAAGLITTGDRMRALSLSECPDLRWCCIVGSGQHADDTHRSFRIVGWDDLMGADESIPYRPLETDMAAIIYTSGSTGRPKGVVLSHRNLVVGAQSVAGYLGNEPEDRILALLPLSFDAGLSQLTTAFAAGASVVLLNYLLPSDAVRACEKFGITGITGVPPLWIQLAEQNWPEPARRSLRYFANTGGKMPGSVLGKLRKLFPEARPYLMYGLTEAFRSTYLPPEQIDIRPDSIGKAIPGVEVSVVRPDGSPCNSGEPGELVHRGPLVAMGYWNDPENTRLRFRPSPDSPVGLPFPDIAVWSGDTVRKDEEGFLYFVGRSDDTIKTSGYRVSPTEVEEAAYATGMVSEAAAVGVPHERLGEAIVLAACFNAATRNSDLLIAELRKHLPGFMLPAHIQSFDEGLPRSPNGKIDRKSIRLSLNDLFASDRKDIGDRS